MDGSGGGEMAWTKCCICLVSVHAAADVRMCAFVCVYLRGVTPTLPNKNPPRSGLNNGNYTAAKAH